jgi:hypothetical protein
LLEPYSALFGALSLFESAHLYIAALDLAVHILGDASPQDRSAPNNHFLPWFKAPLVLVIDSYANDCRRQAGCMTRGTGSGESVALLSVILRRDVQSSAA